MLIKLDNAALLDQLLRESQGVLNFHVNNEVIQLPVCKEVPEEVAISVGIIPYQLTAGQVKVFFWTIWYS